MGRRSREKREMRERGEIKPEREKPETLLAITCKGIIWLGTCLALFTPLIISSRFFFPFVGLKSIYFMGLVEIVFAAWLILILFEPKYRPRFSCLSTALILFLIILILSSVLGVNPSNSFWSKYERMTGLLMWLHLLFFFLVISSVFKRKDWFIIFSVSIFAAILVTLISLFPKGENQIGLLASTRGGATIGNSSFMAGYLLFNVFLALYLFLRTGNVMKMYAGIGLLLVGTGLFKSTGYAAIISFLGGIFLLVIFSLVFSGKPIFKKIGITVFFLSLLLAGILINFLVQHPENIPSQYKESLLGGSFKSRLVVWPTAIRGWLERPLLGWGPENFDVVFTKYFDPRQPTVEYGGEWWFDRAHNIIFDTLVTSGILGMLFYLGIFVSAFYILWRRYFLEKNDFLLPSIFSVILISYFIQNLTVFDMVNSYMIWFLVLGFIGSIVAPRETMPSRGFQGSIPNLFTIIILIIFSLSLFKFVVQPFKADAYVIDAIQSPSPRQRVALYKKTLDTSQLGKYQIRDFFADKPISFVQTEEAKNVSVEDFKSELDFISRELEKSIKDSPLDFRSYLKLGRIYNLYGRIDPSKLSQAVAVLEKAIEISPNNQQGYWTLAQTRLYQGDFQAALSSAEEALALEKRIFNSYWVVVQVAKVMGDRDLATRKIQEAIEINPAWEEELKNILDSIPIATSSTP